MVGGGWRWLVVLVVVGGDMSWCMWWLVVGWFTVAGGVGGGGLSVAIYLMRCVVV